MENERYLMKNFDLNRHVNYVHLVGQVQDINYCSRGDKKSSYCLIDLNVQTEFNDKQHEANLFNIILWDKLADAFNEENVNKSDLLSIEGRLTIYKGKYNVTGNKVYIVRRVPNKEPFLQEVIK